MAVPGAFFCGTSAGRDKRHLLQTANGQAFAKRRTPVAHGPWIFLESVVATCIGWNSINEAGGRCGRIHSGAVLNKLHPMVRKSRGLKSCASAGTNERSHLRGFGGQFPSSWWVVS